MLQAGTGGESPGAGPFFVAGELQRVAGAWRAQDRTKLLVPICSPARGSCGAGPRSAPSVQPIFRGMDRRERGVAIISWTVRCAAPRRASTVTGLHGRGSHSGGAGGLCIAERQAARAACRRRLPTGCAPRESRSGGRYLRCSPRPARQSGRRRAAGRPPRS